MATYSLTSGALTYSNTLTAGTADLVEFADRAGYVTVTNTGSTLMYARADGQLAVAATEGCLPVMPGETKILANGLELWFQSSKVIAQGANAGTPGEVQPFMASLVGQETDPGTKVSVISTAADTYSIGLTG